MKAINRLDRTMKHPNLRIDKKNQYEYWFILCLSSYVLFTIFDLLLFGKDAIQWHILYNGYDFIADYTNVIGYASNLNPYNSTMVFGLHERAYPPLQYLVSYFISTNVSDINIYYDAQNFTSLYVEPKVTFLYLLFVIISVVGFFECIRVYKNGSEIIRTLTALSLSLSFPIIFTIERGNSILAVIVFVLFYLCFYDHDNRFLRELAFIALAIAAAIKMSPAILGVLLLFEKRWRDAIRTVIYGLLLFFMPFLFFKDGFNNIPLFFRNLSLQLEAYKYDSGCTIKGYIIYFSPYFVYDNFETINTICSVITVLICILLLLAAFLTKRKCDRLLYLLLILIILPSHSAMYCILYIIPCLVAFLNECDKKTLDKYILLGGVFCVCRLGGDIGMLLINAHNGLLIILLCAIIKSFETVIVTFKSKNNVVIKY